MDPISEINYKKDSTLLLMHELQNQDKEPAFLFRSIYDVLYKSLSPNSIPQAILIIAGYQYKAAFVADQEINMVACLTEIMAGCKFK